MRRRSRNGLQHHGSRPVGAGRMMHVTQRVLGDISSLRTAPFRTQPERLLEGARERGIKVVAWAIHVNHIHVCCIPRDARALADAMRYLFGRLARWINGVLCPGRRGRVFDDRFFSRSVRAANDVFRCVAYVLSNPVRSGLAATFVWADRSLLSARAQERAARCGLSGAPRRSAHALEDRRRHPAVGRVPTCGAPEPPARALTSIAPLLANSASE
ncbi:MAG: REP element-mobilizing transposase RayT, partial [Myxococcota bacterium]